MSIIRAHKKPRLPVNGSRDFMMPIGTQLKLRKKLPGLCWHPGV